MSKPTREIVTNVRPEELDMLLHLKQGEKLGVAYFEVRKPGRYMLFLRLKGYVKKTI